MDDRPTPDRSLVELALRVADHECEKERPGSYWFGSREALRWALGHRQLGPVSGAFDEIDLDTSQGRTDARREAESAYAAMSGGRRTELPMPFLTGPDRDREHLHVDRDWERVRRSARSLLVARTLGLGVAAQAYSAGRAPI